MKMARFVHRDGVPSWVDERTLSSGAHKEFYETHEFTGDDLEILFSGNLNGLDMIAHIRAESRDQRTARSDEHRDLWDEHAQMSPRGRKIVWMLIATCPNLATPQTS
jgi:hypothetical protein